MQVMVVEFARHVLGLEKADSTEMQAQTAYPVISLLEEQRMVTDRGGTMRLGAYPCRLKSGSHAEKSYASPLIKECHRHRYELNNKYRPEFEKAGLLITGVYEEADLCEIVEVKSHPWMTGVQFHPEFGSKPTEPHPLFKSFIEATIKQKKS